MKKKRGQKNSSDFKSKNHVFALVGLFLVLGFALSFIALPQGVSITGEQVTDVEASNPITDVKDFFGGIFNLLSGELIGEDQENGEIAFLKWTFFIVLSILFFSIFSSIQWPGNRFLMWVIAMPLAFLSIRLIAGADLITSIQGYGALGLTFISILPIAVMFLFTAMLLQGTVTPGKILFQLVLWWYFLAYTFYVLISYAIGNYAENTFSWGVFLITLSPVVIAFCFIVFNKWFRTWVRQLGRELTIEVGHDVAAARESTIASTE